jgi:hypothetical protein
MATAIIGVGAGAVIITDGVEAEAIITAGGIIATDFRFHDFKEVASAGGLFRFSGASAFGICRA